MNRHILAALLAAAAIAGTPAQAATDVTAMAASVTALGGGAFSFSVGGWGGGGLVSGSFTGIDSDANGQLSSFDGEVTGFGMTYSGGSIVGAFGLGFGDLFGLVYDLDGGVLGDGTALDIEGIGAIGGGGAFSIGPGPVALCGTGEPCGVIEGPAAGGVPEPASWALMIAGFGLIGAALRRRPVAIKA
jgi:hypothetical protein